MTRFLYLFLLVIIYPTTVFSQAIYRAYPSDVLETERNIKVLKPRNYAENPEKSYPLIIVLDGDYLFEPVAGNVDYLSYWDQMPESFVVGINQRESRYDETAIDRNSGFPEPQTAAFMDFVMEVHQTMQDEFRIAPFSIIVGKDITANLASYYLMRKKVPFKAFININPKYSDLIKDNLVNKISGMPHHQYYYVAVPEKTSSIDDVITTSADSLLKTKENVHLKYDKIKDVDSYSIAAHAIPRALSYIFDEYKLLDDEQLASNMVKQENTTNTDTTTTSPLEKLQEKYAYIKQVYGIEIPIRLRDVVTVSEHYIDNKDYDSLLDVADIAIKEFPDLLYGRFIEGLAYEGLDRIPRAIKSYNAAYTLEPAVGLTKDDVLDKIEMLQAKE